MKRAFSLLFVAACSSGAATTAPAPSAEIAALAPDVSEVACAVDDDARDLEEHACLHATSGPFADVVATGAAGAPAISRPHTAYRVEIRGDERWVSFQAQDAGTHVFFSTPPARLAIRRADGTTVMPSCEGAVSDVCVELEHQVQASLDASETVHVAVFGETPTKLVVEHL